MATVAGRFTDLPRIAGFTWVLEWEIWDFTGQNHSEVVYSTLDPTSANGGTYFVHHDSKSGQWFAYEMGGAGPMTWEREIEGGELFPSPLHAMRAVKDIYERTLAHQEEAEIDLGLFLRGEKQREQEHRDAINY